MAHTKDPLQAFVLSRDAVGLANQAFFDPSMMGLLYFVSWSRSRSDDIMLTLLQPNEHKYAVYSPLFAPIAIPLVVGLLKELLGWIRRRKVGKQKATTGEAVSDDTVAGRRITEESEKRSSTAATASDASPDHHGELDDGSPPRSPKAALGEQPPRGELPEGGTPHSERSLRSRARIGASAG